MTTEHVLIIGRSRRQHAHARSLGLRLSALVPQRQIGSLDHGLYHRLIGMAQDADGDAWVETAALVHRLDPIHAIGAFNVQTQKYAAKIAERLGLPFHAADVIRRTTQKDELRQTLREAGLDTTASRRVSSEAELTAFADAHGYPVVLKPVDGAGSLGISIVRSAADAPLALARFERAAPGRIRLVEKFLAGDEYSVEGFSEHGRHHVIAVTQKFKDPETCVETGHCLPAPIPTPLRAEIADFVGRALTALGVADGPSHTEVMVTPEGPRIIETHTRLGGDNIVDLVRLVTGIDLYDLWVRQICGERVLDQLVKPTERFAAVWFVTPAAEGTLVEVTGIEAARAFPGVEEVTVLQPPGRSMGGATHSDARGASVVATADTAAEAVDRARGAATRLRFILSCVG